MSGRRSAWVYDGKIGAEDMPTAGQLKKALELWDIADTARETTSTRSTECAALGCGRIVLTGPMASSTAGP